MRLLLDECVSPALVEALRTEEHLAYALRDLGALREQDHEVLARAIGMDAAVVTQNARDFRPLVAAEEIHPGLITLPSVGPDRSLELLRRGIRYLEQLGDPADVIVNHVLEIKEDGAVRLYELPAPPV